MNWKREGKRMGYSDSHTLHKKALAALRGNWQTALLVTFSAALLGAVVNAIQVRLDAVDVYGSQLGAVDLAGLLQAMSREAESHWYITLLGIVNALIAPALGLGDGGDLAHTGFRCFIDVLEDYSPKYFFHGHMHLNYKKQDRIRMYKNTTIVNGYGYHLMDCTF
jgi:hypothetical protein